jgi:hypothetical protein
MISEESLHLMKVTRSHPCPTSLTLGAVRALSNVAQFYMAILSASPNLVDSAVILASGIVAFVASMLEVILDLRFPPHKLRNN